MDGEMQYRPEYRLDRLRMMRDDSSRSNIGRREGEPLLPLRWLRTMVVDLSHTAAKRDAGKRLALQLRSAVGCAVERVVCKDVSKKHLAQLLSFVKQRVALLTSLDLRGCGSWSVNDSFLRTVADAHGLSLRRLYLPEDSGVAQSTLDRFTQLEELDASRCENLTNVDFCSATLRVLYASCCDKLTDAGLRRATRLEVLHVESCWQVTDVSPFAHCLLGLDASDNCGIGSGVLSDCRRLQVLDAGGNDKITTLQPFAQRLRELGAASSALDDAALADATGLVSLSVGGNRAITTVAPFGASLIRLCASGSNIGDAGLVTAANLVHLDASCNVKIRSLAPFCTSLLELRSFCRRLSQTALSAATNLIWLEVSDNKRITTVQSCGRSLRHLVAKGDSCALTDEGVSAATQLVTLYCGGNRNLTTMAPFLHSLEELETDSEALCLEVGRAPNLRCIKGWLENRCIAELDRNGFFCGQLGEYGYAVMLRNAVTYEYNSTEQQF